jgi:hypothetical protein
MDRELLKRQLHSIADALDAIWDALDRGDYGGEQSVRQAQGSGVANASGEGPANARLFWR